MNCYLCNSLSFRTRKGQVPDEPNLKILECINCGLVTLSSSEHIQSGFYENSGMHGSEMVSIEHWLKNADWDDQRRFNTFKSIFTNKRILDFGCGAGGFLNKAKDLASSVEGVELESRVKDYWQEKIAIHPKLEMAGMDYDLITAFHVLEHLPNPIEILKILGNKLSEMGRIIIEVPNSEDALLTLYESEDFQNFTYWSQHLFLFNAETLSHIARKAGLRIISIQQYQRYTISNHLYWLSKGKPGGHKAWTFLDTPELQMAYAKSLAAIAKCDTLIAHLELIR
jgi:2-polyprenyl-3-methyl-5-hydroxy-6-metoxy-1,4-benzoquinol methylase